MAEIEETSGKLVTGVSCRISDSVKYVFSVEFSHRIKFTVFGSLSSQLFGSYFAKVFHHSIHMNDHCFRLWRFLNAVFDLVDFPDDLSWPAGLVAKLVATSGKQSWRVEITKISNTKLHRFDTCIISALGTIEHDFQLILNNSIRHLHFSANFV